MAPCGLSRKDKDICYLKAVPVRPPRPFSCSNRQKARKQLPETRPKPDNPRTQTGRTSSVPRVRRSFMDPDGAKPDPGLEQFRPYLDLLVRRQVDGRFR